MDMTRDLIDRIVDLGGNFGLVDEDSQRKVIAIAGKIATVNKFAPARAHTFYLLEGFLDYLNSAHCANDSGIIFVGDDRVTAALRYQTQGAHLISLPLVPSEERIGLELLCKGMNQKALWQTLITKLDGAIEPELLMQISNIQISTSTKDEIQVQQTGLRNSTGDSSARITWAAGKGTASADVRTSWTWEGRIWECFDATFKVDLNMEIIPEGVLKFVFHPRRLQSAMRAAKLELVAEIKANIPATFTCHEGTL